MNWKYKKEKPYNNSVFCNYKKVFPYIQTSYVSF